MRKFFDSAKPSGKCAFSWPLFLLGLFSETQIMLIGSIGIAEVTMFAIGPFFLLKDWYLLRRNGFAAFLWLLIFMLISGWISNEVNHVDFARAVRGIATPYSYIMCVATFHHFLKDDIKKTKWFFIGLALSTILSVFVFQRGANRFVDGYEVSASEAMHKKMNYSLFWLHQLVNALSMPINAYYLELPKVYPVAAILFLLFYGFMRSNNRSSLIIFGGSLLLFLVGGKRSRAMQFVKRNFFLIVIGALIAAPLANAGYKFAASSGALGEAALKKYESQIGKVKGGGVLQTIMSGRGEVFIGLSACLDQPLLGHGSWPQDTRGYTASFFAKHGATEKELEFMRESEVKGVVPISAHSWFVQSWLWYGIGGLVWVLYLGGLMLHVFKNCLGAIPHLYGYFAFLMPAHLWNWFFSPMGGRTALAMFFTLCLFARCYAREQKRRRDMVT